MSEIGVSPQLLSDFSRIMQDDCCFQFFAYASNYYRAHISKHLVQQM